MEKRKILYIEDNATNRLVVVRLLRNAGYLVAEAVDGLSGIEAAVKENPDLILMDMEMPGLDGYEVTTRLKGTPGLGSIPIVAVTGHILDGDRERTITAGCEGYITKPIDVSSFVSQVEEYLGGRKDSVDRENEAGYLKEYSGKLVFRLEEKVRELTRINQQLEQRVTDKVKEAHAAQQQLLQSEKMAGIGQLAAGVAHEINNPVGYIYSNLSSLHEYVNDLLSIMSVYDQLEDSQQDPAAVIKEARELKQKLDFEYLQQDLVDLVKESQEGAVRVKDIIQDLKDFSRVDEAEWQWADIHKGLDSTLNIVNNEIKYKAEVTKEYGDLPPIECLSSQLNQVFMNILVNAAHAIENRGNIHITTELVDGWARIAIRDNGSGIAPENINRIFEPFFTTKSVGKGTGLGLSLSYGIVQKHGGKLEVESRPGEGTQFTILLPELQERRGVAQAV